MHFDVDSIFKASKHASHCTVILEDIALIGGAVQTGEPIKNSAESVPPDECSLSRKKKNIETAPCEPSQP